MTKTFLCAHKKTQPTLSGWGIKLMSLVLFFIHTYDGKKTSTELMEPPWCLIGKRKSKKKRIFWKRTYKLISTYRLSFFLFCLLKKHFSSFFHRRLSLCMPRFFFVSGVKFSSCGCHMCVFFIFSELFFQGWYFSSPPPRICVVLYYCLTLLNLCVCRRREEKKSH